MSGISRLLAKELSSALGIIDNPKYNKMFKETEEVLPDVTDPADPTVARFYSPLESAIENAPIGKEGTRGENVEAFVRKRAPKVTAAEMEYRGLGLEPGALYTSETAKEGLGALEVKAVKLEPGYTPTQRQVDLQDPELDYVELGLTARGSQEGKLPGLEELDHYNRGFYSYPDSVLAHSRYSVRKGDTDYILIEELQSDSVQGIVPNTEAHYKKVREDFYKAADKELDDITDEIEFDLNENFSAARMKEAVRRYENILSNSKEPKEDFKKLLIDFDTPQQYVEVFANKSSIHAVLARLVPDNLSNDVANEVDLKIQRIQDLAADPVRARKQTITSKQAPITRTTDYVRMLLQSVISDAKQRGINEIVIPPVERIAFWRVSTEEALQKAVTKGSPFYATYEDAVNKVLKQFKAELGNQIKIGTKTLPYADKPIEAKLLDISNLELDPTKTKLRFNKGGLVERRTK